MTKTSSHGYCYTRSIFRSFLASFALILVSQQHGRSEAFATSFVPRSLLIPRGGSSSNNNSKGASNSNRTPLTCVLQAPKGGGHPLFANGEDYPKNGNNRNVRNGSSNGASTNGQSETSMGASSSSTDIPGIIPMTTRGGSTSSFPKEEEAITHANYVAETNLPTDVGHFRLRAYRIPESSKKGKYVGSEPCVIYSTNKPPFGTATHPAENVPVRIHDQCFTSEVFRSQRCDCKEQLKMSLDYIHEHGGAIIYLQQEGRGIGLANKIAAYALQDVGMDTVDANIHLGFPEDCRQYGVVPSILKDMNINSVQIMTNNPRKVDRLKALGVEVADETIPMVVQKANPHNRRYLQTKQDRMNHANFGAMLSSSPNSIMSSIDISEMDITQVASANGVMLPRRKPLAEEYINEGEEMAAAAVTSSLLDDDESQTGVTAADDGYCFGRQTVEDAIQAVNEGKMVVVVDDENRENEGDLIMAADMCTPEAMAKIVRYSSGVVCVAMEGDRMDDLKLPAMVSTNEDPKGTAFSVTVDATKEHGITTGISARDRAKTIRMLADGSSKATDFARPGHIFPLRAREGGVLERDGHTEAAIDLSRLAGLSNCGVLCEIVSEEDPVHMARLPELKRFCKQHGFVLTSIVDIAQYRRDTEQ